MNGRKIAPAWTGLALAALGGAAWAAPAAPQEEAPAAREQGFVTVELRVGSGPGPQVTVDRGGSDALAEGDVVRFQPRSGGNAGGIVIGSVSGVNRRSATVTLHDPNIKLEVGTQGQVNLPRKRLAEVAERRRAAREEREAARRARALPDLPPTPEEEPEDEVETPWSNLDERYEQGMPLLAEVGMLRPEERKPRLSGRYYAIVDHIITSDDGRKSGFYRLGTSMRYSNPGWFGEARGGEIYVDAELNHKNADVPDNDDDDGTTLRLDRLSYRWGGDRFAPVGQEAGRFLQRWMPEFGVLDGYAWDRRLDDGNRYGFSAGFMPEPDEDMESGHDFQLAAWYRWVNDVSERVSASAGYQKTWNNGGADRDLVVGKFHVLPQGGWSYSGTAWLDLYTSGDDAKGSGAGLTQAYLNAFRTLDSSIRGKRNSVSFTYSHLEFPDIERNEFLYPGPEEIEDERRDRLAFTSRRWLREDQRWVSSLGVWVDDEEEGVDGELGFEVVLPNTRAGVSAFGSHGEFTTALGLRGSYGHYGDRGYWDVSYEVVNQDNVGFADDNDDLIQQRLRATREYRTDSGWNINGYVEGNYWEREEGLTLGFYVTRSF